MPSRGPAAWRTLLGCLVILCWLTGPDCGQAQELRPPELVLVRPTPRWLALVGSARVRWRRLPSEGETSPGPWLEQGWGGEPVCRLPGLVAPGRYEFSLEFHDLLWRVRWHREVLIALSPRLEVYPGEFVFEFNPLPSILALGLLGLAAWGLQAFRWPGVRAGWLAQTHLGGGRRSGPAGFRWSRLAGSRHPSKPFFGDLVLGDFLVPSDPKLGEGPALPQALRAALPVDLVIGVYQVTGVLGEGGMAVVLKAKDAQGRPRALKVPRGDLLGEPSILESFARESEILRGLSHLAVPFWEAFGIYVLRDLGEIPYLATELVHGQALDALLREQGPLKIDRVCTLASAMAEALTYLHGQGIVHLDFKPSNMMYTTEGTLKVVDFGLARRVMQRQRGDVVLGTPCYLAPEQLDLQHRVDGRADLYALGVVIYEMLTGHVPYEGTTQAILEAVRAHPAPSCRSLVPWVPPGLEALLERLLQPRPDDRPGSAREVLMALEALREDPSGGSG